MKKKHVISLMIVGAVIALCIIVLNIDRSDMRNTEKILVTVGETQEIYEIDDKEIINKIVNKVIKDEKAGFDLFIQEPYEYALEFFTPENGYGPLLCYRGLGVCIFERDTAGNYIQVDEKFFKWIEEGMKN
ncbi:MAG TPA: hypothetical protein GX392_06545 [Clostridiales bacterium]|nr:hypothetical protein [Clostridiales bacterium]